MINRGVNEFAAIFGSQNVTSCDIQQVVYWYIHAVFSNYILLILQITDLVRCDPTRSDQTLVYILTLGVVEAYRKFGIGMFLLLKSSLIYWRM